MLAAAGALPLALVCVGTGRNPPCATYFGTADGYLVPHSNRPGKLAISCRIAVFNGARLSYYSLEPFMFRQSGLSKERLATGLFLALSSASGAWPNKRLLARGANSVMLVTAASVLLLVGGLLILFGPVCSYADAIGGARIWHGDSQHFGTRWPPIRTNVQRRRVVWFAVLLDDRHRSGICGMATDTRRNTGGVCSDRFAPLCIGKPICAPRMTNGKDSPSNSGVDLIPPFTVPPYSKLCSKIM